MSDEWIKTLADHRRVKFTNQELDERAFLTAQVEGNKVVYSIVLSNANNPLSREEVETHFEGELSKHSPKTTWAYSEPAFSASPRSSDWSTLYVSEPTILRLSFYISVLGWVPLFSTETWWLDYAAQIAVTKAASLEDTPPVKQVAEEKLAGERKGEKQQPGSGKRATPSRSEIRHWAKRRKG
jgi:hypothetical protein